MTVRFTSRGFENAGLYDPPGVGGTHVMYVLHHADQPQLYANLPKDPKIDPFVELWKGNLKLGGLFAIGKTKIPGLMLHAFSLAIPHPKGGTLDLSVQPPDAFRKTAAALGLDPMAALADLKASV